MAVLGVGVRWVWDSGGVRLVLGIEFFFVFMAHGSMAGIFWVIKGTESNSGGMTRAR
jgi:hypothetical protein